MIVIIGTNIPNRVRGILKIWFIEIKPGVLIGNVNSTVEERIVKFIEQYLNNTTDLLLIRSNNSNQGFDLRYNFNSIDNLKTVHGLLLSAKKVVDK